MKRSDSIEQTMVGCTSFYFRDMGGEENEMRIHLFSVTDSKISIDVDFYKQGDLISVLQEMSFKHDGGEIVLFTEPFHYSFPIKNEFHLCYLGYLLVIGRRGIQTVEEIDFYDYGNQFFK